MSHSSTLASSPWGLPCINYDLLWYTKLCCFTYLRSLIESAVPKWSPKLWFLVGVDLLLDFDGFFLFIFSISYRNHHNYIHNSERIKLGLSHVGTIHACSSRVTCKVCLVCILSFEYYKNRLCSLDITWQPIGGAFTVYIYEMFSHGIKTETVSTKTERNYEQNINFLQNILLVIPHPHFSHLGGMLSVMIMVQGNGINDLNSSLGWSSLLFTSC